MAFFIGAMIKGAGGPSSLFDPYVGYADKDRAYRVKLSAYAAGKAAYKAAVMNAYDAALAEFRDRYDRDAIAIQEIREIAAEADERATEVRDSTAEWIEMGGISIRRYREENRSVRTSDAPAYFDHYPTFEEVAVGLRDAAAVAEAAARAVAAHEANGRLLAAIEMRVVALRERQIAAFDTEIARIESEAEKRVDEAALAEPVNPVDLAAPAGAAPLA